MKLSPGKYTDPRVDPIWGIIQKVLRSQSLEYWASRLQIDKSTVSRRYTEFPTQDSLAYRNIKAIETILELIDIFGIEILKSLAEVFSAHVINPDENIIRMEDQARMEITQAQEALRLAKQHLLDIQKVKKERGIK